LDQLLAEVEARDREQESGEGAGAGSGWSRKGEVQTLSANPEGAAPIFEPGLNTGVDQGSAAGEPEAGQLAQSAEAAAARCDFQSVHGIAGELSRFNPGHPWLAGRYRQIQADEANYQAAQASLAQARGVLERPEPTNGDIQQAAQIALQAQSIAPPCMSQQVSMLNGPIYQAQAAVQARNRANRQAGMESLLGALVSVQSALGSSGAAPGYQPSYPSDSGISTLTSAIGQATGGTVPTAGSDLAGGSAPNCNACVISAFSSGGAYPYLFEFAYSFSNQGGCTTGRMRTYEVISFAPDEDANGNALQHANSSAARYLQAKRGYGGAQARQVCGPCGSASQAQATMRQLCPQPAHNMSGGPGGVVLDGQRISP
jgi:hypothetical protein